MDNLKKIIIIVLVVVIAVLAGLVFMGISAEDVKTVELFENGTTIEVPKSTNLTSHDEFSTTYVTAKDTRIIGIDSTDFAGALAVKVISELIVEKGEMQDSGLYKLDKKSIMEIGDKLGEGYDKDDLKDVFVAIRHNSTINQSVIVIGNDEGEISKIAESISWKKGVSTVNATPEQSTSDDSSKEDKTYPFYADDGSVVGYYHVGDVVTYNDGLYQLKSDGEWEYIGEAPGSSSDAYSQGYSDGVDDSASSDDDDADDYYDDEYVDDEDYEE